MEESRNHPKRHLTCKWFPSSAIVEKIPFAANANSFAESIEIQIHPLACGCGRLSDEWKFSQPHNSLLDGTRKREEIEAPSIWTRAELAHTKRTRALIEVEVFVTIRLYISADSHGATNSTAVVAAFWTVDNDSIQSSPPAAFGGLKMKKFANSTIQRRKSVCALSKIDNSRKKSDKKSLFSTQHTKRWFSMQIILI